MDRRAWKRVSTQIKSYGDEIAPYRNICWVLGVGLMIWSYFRDWFFPVIAFGVVGAPVLWLVACVARALLQSRKTQVHVSDDGLLIRKAWYGTDERVCDVTDVLRGKVQNDRLLITVTNSTLAIDANNDPCKGTRKHLVVGYCFDGTEDILSVKERDTLDIPRP